MKSYNYTITDKTISNIIDFDFFKNNKNVLIQIFCGQGKNTLESITKNILKELPQGICIGSTTDGEINNDKVQTNSTIITISVFNETKVEITYSQNESSFKRGNEIANTLIKNNTKLLILFTDSLNTNAEEFLKGIEAINNKVMVCGGMAGDNGEFTNTYISCQDKIFNNAAVAVSLSSDCLSVQNDYRFNWSDIGIEHVITEVKDNRVYEINGTKVLDFYKKYLGEDIQNTLPQSATSFPLLLRKNNEYYARALVKIDEDGSFKFSGNLNNGDRVKFGFGNAEMILKYPIIPNEKDYSNTESFFIYSCMARRRYVADMIQAENQAYANITNTSGMFTYGEFYHEKGKNKLLNQALTVVALSENDKSEKNNLIQESALRKTNSEARTIQTLTHLIEQSSKDHDEQSNHLEIEKINSQMLVTSQKIFLRHAVHETNTPISVIMSNIELFEMEYGKNHYLSTIEVALKNIFNIYDDLSYLVKKDQVEYPKNSIDLVDYTRSRIEFFEQSAKQIGSQIKFFSDQDTLHFDFNETKLQRIIDNNLTNAIKYTEENSNIYITLKKELNAYALIISSCSQYIKYPEKIFKEYYREETTSEGFGLGLSLVKRICNEENIEISIDSNEYYTSFRYLFKMENK